MLLNGTTARALTAGLGGVSGTADSNTTMAAIVRRPAAGAWGSVIGIKTSAELNCWALGFNSSNQLNVALDGATDVAGPTISPTTGPYYIGADKTAGSSAVRFHEMGYGTDQVLNHANGGSVGGPARARHHVTCGTFESNDWFSGDIWVAGIWNRVLADWEHEWLAASIAAWFWLNPDFLIVEDASGALPTNIPDLSGKGAPLTTLTNLAVSTVSMPVGWGAPELLSSRQPAAGGTSVTLTPATETDTALALSLQFVKALTPGAETDTAVALTALKQVTLTPAGETDTGQALALQKVATLTPAGETDTAIALTAQKPVGLTPATETDTAPPASVVKAATIVPAAETDTAVALTFQKVVTLTPATETDTAIALSVGSGTSVTLTPATETDTAQALTVTKRATLTLAGETDTAVALSFSGPIIRNLTAGTETDAAVPLTWSYMRVLTPAVETDTALPVGRLKLVTLTPALETDQARPLVLGYFKTLIPAGETDSAIALVFAGGSPPFTYRLDDTSPFTYDDAGDFTYSLDDTAPHTYGLD